MRTLSPIALVDEAPCDFVQVIGRVLDERVAEMAYDVILMYGRTWLPLPIHPSNQV